MDAQCRNSDRMHRYGPRGRRFAGAISLTAVVSAVIIAITGCTAVPHEDFSAYRQAFAEARQASKPLINDLGLGWHEAATIEANGEDSAIDDWQTFGPADPVRPLTIDEQVLVRHQLWLVTERYNDALAALAEGRSPEQVAGLVNGFLSSVRDLPIRRLAELTAGVQPLGGVISDALFLAEREVNARQFRRAVEAGGSLVEAILLAMQQEISDHYDLRLVLNIRARRELDEVVQLDLLPAFLNIYESTGEHEDKQPILGELNDALRTQFRYRDDQLLDAADDEEADSPSASELAQLVMIAEAVKSKAMQFDALRGELLSYQEVLKAYHELLDIARHRMTVLRQATDEGRTESANDVLLAATNLHWLFTRYQNARANR